MRSIDEKIREIVTHAQQSTRFYSEAFAKFNIDASDIKGAADLGMLPVVETSDLLECNAKLHSDTVRPYRISSSSGTYCNPKTLFKTPEDTDTSTAIMCRLFEMAGLRRGDSLLIAQPFDLAQIGYLSLEACRRMEVLAIPVGLSVTNERLLEFIQLYRPTAIFTSPSRMSVITKMVEQSMGGAYPELSKILFAGERVLDRHREAIHRFWGVYPHNLYGSEETDGLAGSCEQHSGLHFMDDQFHLELVRPGTDEPVPRGEVGEAVITSLYAKGTPLIRYRLGDLIWRHDTPCPCGIPSPLISVYGRSADVLYLYDGIKLYAYQVEKVLKERIPDMQNYQLRCRNVHVGIEELIVAVQADIPGDANVLEDIVCREIWNCSLDLAAAHDIGSLRIKVEIGPEDLVVNRRGKTPRIIDMRHESLAETGTE